MKTFDEWFNKDVCPLCGGEDICHQYFDFVPPIRGIWCTDCRVMILEDEFQSLTMMLGEDAR